MVHNDTLGPDATGARTGVDAFLIVAGHVGGAVRTEDALWPTVWRRVPVAGDAGADCLVIYLSALTVGSAGRRVTWIFGSFYC